MVILSRSASGDPAGKRSRWRSRASVCKPQGMRRSIKSGRVISVVGTYADVALDVADLNGIFGVANLRIDGQ